MRRIDDIANRILARLLWQEHGPLSQFTQHSISDQRLSVVGAGRLHRGEALAEIGINLERGGGHLRPLLPGDSVDCERGKPRACGAKEHEGGPCGATVYNRSEAAVQVPANQEPEKCGGHHTTPAASFTSHREAVGETCDASGMGAAGTGDAVPAAARWGDRASCRPEGSEAAE